MLKGLQTVVSHSDSVVVLLQNPDSKLLVDSVVFGQKNLERLGMV
jgi:hypothetical protein